MPPCKHLYLCLSLLLFSGLSHGSSVFIGHSNSERTVAVTDTNLHLSPSGTEFYLNFDINENWSISGDYSKIEDTAFSNNIIVEYETDSQGLGISYYTDKWAVYYQFTEFENLQSIGSPLPETGNLDTRNNSNSHSLSASYFITLSQSWQMSASAGLHYNDWQEVNIRSFQQTISNPAQIPLTTEESGDANLVSISVNFTRYATITETVGFTIGAYIGWNEVIDNNSELAININRSSNRNNGRIRGNDANNSNNNFVVTGSESYGIASIYASFDFYENWILDFDMSTDFESITHFNSSDSSHVWSIGLGYVF